MRVVALVVVVVSLLPAVVHAGPPVPKASAATPTAGGAAADAYTCPMHCEGEKTYDEAHRCPVCGMALGLADAPHYRVDVTPEAPILPGVETTLTFTIADPDGKPVRRLEVVHEKLLHLLITSADLAWFAHEHPSRRRDGTFTLRMTFPAAGRYTLFHDFTPPRVGMQVVPVDVTVEGPPLAPTPLVVDADRPKTVDGYTAALTPSAPLVAGKNLSLAVSLSREGTPVTDLEPFLGAMGHLIIVSADRTRFVHSHPVERSGARPTRGPEISFQCHFPAPGTYKAWAQFQRRGQVLTVPFTMEVRGS